MLTIWWVTSPIWWVTSPDYIEDEILEDPMISDLMSYEEADGYTIEGYLTSTELVLSPTFFTLVLWDGDSISVNGHFK